MYIFLHLDIVTFNQKARKANKYKNKIAVSLGHFYCFLCFCGPVWACRPVKGWAPQSWQI